MATIQSTSVYFGQEQEQAITDYINATTGRDKNIIYEQKIHPAFMELASRILYRYGMNFGFFNAGFEHDDLVSMGVSFMYDRLVNNKFNPDAPTQSGRPVKAFSFFGTIVKRYYIKLSMDSQKSLKRNIDIDNKDVLIDYNSHDNLVHHHESDLVDNDKDFYAQMVNWFNDYHKSIGIKTEAEIKIMKLFLDLVRSADLIDNYNKKALYIYIREMSDEPTVRISGTLKKMYPAYHALRQNYINSNGTIITGSLII